jgi:orotidine-5'-phosphate decarboxylase
MQNNEPLYTNVAKMIANWGANSIGENGYSAVGAVVGATYPDEAKKMRALMPKNFWLVPGYGAQGGNAESVKHCFNADGLGAIINSSRGIIYDPDPRQAVVKMRDELNAIRMNPAN